MPHPVEVKSADISRRQKAHLRKEQMQTRWLLAGFGGVLVLIIAVIVFGALYTFIFRQSEALGTVYGETVTIGQYQREFRYEVWTALDPYQIQIDAAKAAGQKDLAASYYSQATSLWTVFNTSAVFHQMVSDSLSDAIVAKHEAALNGIAVSDEEVEAEIQKNFYYAPATVRTAASLRTATPTLAATETSTPGGPTAMPTLTASPTLLATIGMGATPVPTLVPTEQTEEMYRTNYAQFLARLKEKTGMSETDYRERIRTGLLIDKVRAAVIETMPKVQTHLHIQEIVADSIDAAVSTKARLDRGDDWVTVARETSVVGANKDLAGDMGWMPISTFDSTVQSYLATLKLNEVSVPIQQTASDGSTVWCIYRFIEKIDREVSGADIGPAQNGFYAAWQVRNREDKTVMVMKSVPADILPKDALPTP
jgi:hypothetical protein